MSELNNVPKEDVLKVVKEALRDDVNKITITKQNNGDYTIICAK